MASPLISVIIPTLNEEKALPATLASLIPQPAHQLLICDGGSHDQTSTLVQQHQRHHRQCQWLQTPPGRAQQMNQGAQQAEGEWLLFLHADTRIPPQALSQLLSACQTGGHLAAGFKHRFDTPHPLLRVISWLHNWRFQRTGVLYGDQGLFIQRELFIQLGAFPEQPMEDVLFGERLRQHSRPLLLDTPLYTDARKFQQLGILRALYYVLRIQYRHHHQRPIGSPRFFLPYR